MQGAVSLSLLLSLSYPNLSLSLSLFSHGRALSLIRTLLSNSLTKNPSLFSPQTLLLSPNLITQTQNLHFQMLPSYFLAHPKTLLQTPKPHPFSATRLRSSDPRHRHERRRGRRHGASSQGEDRLLGK